LLIKKYKLIISTKNIVYVVKFNHSAYYNFKKKRKYKARIKKINKVGD